MSDYDSSQALWYVVHTYSGYENKVKDTLMQIVENRQLQDYSSNKLMFRLKIRLKSRTANVRLCNANYIPVTS